MIAIDDGLTSGNLNWADVFFLVGALLALVGAVLYAVVNAKTARWAAPAFALGVAFGLFGLFLL